jgi:hypothetical protein
VSARRIALLAWIGALAVQTGFVAAYHRMTDGCFCAISGLPEPDAPLHVVWFFEVALLPSFLLPPTPTLYIDRFPAVESWSPVLLLAALNSVPWFVAAFALLNAIVFVCRIRVEGSRVVLLRRAEVRARWLVTALLLLTSVALGSGALYRRWWLASAERIVRETVAARSHGSDVAYATTEYEDDDHPRATPSDFAGPYLLVPTGTRRVGTGILDSFVPPFTWVAEARFTNGFRREFTVHRAGGSWKIDIMPAPPAECWTGWPRSPTGRTGWCW